MAPEARPGSLPIQSPPPGATPYSPYPPYAPPGPVYFQPQKAGSAVAVVVVIVIVVVAVTVTLAAVFYFMISGFLTSGPNERPVITLAVPTLFGGNASISVAAASQRVSWQLYNVNLLVNTTVGTPQPLAPSFTLAVGSEAFTGRYLDADGNGLLNAGDSFRVSPDAGWRRQTTYQFEILWSDHSPIGFVSWTT